MADSACRARVIKSMSTSKLLSASDQIDVPSPRPVSCLGSSIVWQRGKVQIWLCAWLAPECEGVSHHQKSCQTVECQALARQSKFDSRCLRAKGGRPVVRRSGHPNRGLCAFFPFLRSQTESCLIMHELVCCCMAVLRRPAIWCGKFR